MKVLAIIVVPFFSLALACVSTQAQSMQLASTTSGPDSTAISNSRPSLQSATMKPSILKPETAGASLPAVLPGTGLLQYHVPFSVLFKYDTTWNNPEHRCYEITKPLSGGTTFLFNFLASEKYNVTAVPK